MYILESKIMKQKVVNNQTYTVARDKIYAENPLLVNQIKTLKIKKNTQMYSTVAASASATDQLKQQQQQFFCAATVIICSTSATNAATNAAADECFSESIEGSIYIKY